LKNIFYILALEAASPGNQHCAGWLYRDLHTFVPCAQFAVIIYYKVQPTQPPVFTAVFQINLCCRLVGGVA